MTKPTKERTKKRLKIALDYTVDLELLNMEELMDSLRQYGDVEITDVAVFDESVSGTDHERGEY